MCPPGRVARILHHRFLGADGLDDRVRAEPVRQLLDLRDAVVAAFGDDVGRPVLESELLPVGVAAHGDDAFGAEVLGGEHGVRADRDQGLYRSLHAAGHSAAAEEHAEEDGSELLSGWS
jgi:hypothetical protein